MRVISLVLGEYHLSMAITHIPVTELPPGLRLLLDRLRSGEEIIIDSDGEPVAVLRAPDRPRGVTVSEVIARLEQRENELGRPLIMEEDYARDMRDIIASRKPRHTSAWD